MSRVLGGDVRFGFANYVHIENGVWGNVDKFSKAPPGYFAAIDEPFYPHLLRWVPLLPSTSIISADLLRDVGGFDPDFGRGLSQDWEHALRCAQYGKVAVVHEPLVGVRRHGGNRTKTQLPSLLGDIRVLEFARDRHPVANRYLAEIQKRYAEKCVEATDLAFVEGRRDLVRKLFGMVPSEHRSWKLTLKAIVAELPVHASLLRAIFGEKIS